MITIAIDGTGSSGKGTVSKKIAQLLNIHHYDTGAIYRAIGLYCYKNNVDNNNLAQVEEHLKKINIKVEFINKEQYTYLNGECVNNEIRSSIVSDYASRFSSIKQVREKVISLQRDFAKYHSVVMEGRDITTVVLPDAKYKFYLDAPAEIRAARRLKDLQAKGENITYEQVLADLVERDRRNKEAEHGKLYIAEDATYINTGNYTPDEIVAIIYSKIDEKN